MNTCRPSGTRTVPLLVLGSLLLALVPSDVRATRVRPVNLEEMAEHAARIFSGRCLSVESDEDGRVEIVFAIDRAVKGVAGETLTVRMAGGDPSGARASEGIVGLPGFSVGEEVVLFLYGESASGLSAPVGLAQGKFAVFEDKRGRRRAVNAFGNRALLRGLSDHARERLGIAPASDDGATAPDDVPPDRLLDWAESLLR
jgi:hypothetical protein